MKLCNSLYKKNIILNKIPLRFTVNVAITLMFILIFHTARLFKVKYSTGIIFNFFSLPQIADPIVGLFSVAVIVSMAVLIFLSAKKIFPVSKKLTFYAVLASSISALAMLIRAYVFVREHYSECEGITVNPEAYVFILLIIALLANNINVKRR